MTPEPATSDKTSKVVDFLERRQSAGQSGSPPAEAPERPSRTRHHTRQATLFVLFAVIVILVGTVVWRMTRAPVVRGILEASGRIEGRITTVSPKSLGRVVKILVDEGQPVSQGQVLAILDDDAQRQRIRGAEENLGSLEQRLQSADTQLAVSTEQVPLQIAQAQDALNQADSSLAGARANAEQAARDADRDAQLFTGGLIAAQQAELSALKSRVTREALREADANMARAQKGLSIAELGLQQLQAQRTDRDSLARQVRQAEAALAEQESYVADFVIRSPLSGTVLTRNIELGEHVNIGDTLYTLVDLKQLYLKVYVPEPDIGRVALGQEARVYVDAYPGRPFGARVNRIYQEAEFTPKNVETKEERVKLVFPVELLLVENPGALLKPGMPADGFLRVEEGASWPATGAAARSARPAPALSRPAPSSAPAPVR
ncbi:MAG TPA: efflux RND transporter periplasmic adaptor subunit [Candidatus Methylomirabilis sp.]|nr:efflux RND transporter periplasmic adaptor subunit [Candidatus Methylomirabilis sp.]